MLVIFSFLVGAIACLIVLLALDTYKRNQFLKNASPDWSKSGVVYLGDFARFQSAFRNVFPSCPARSYVSISRHTHGAGVRHGRRSGTEFYIRSAGKRKGVHSFIGELRLDPADREHAINAMPFLEKIGGPIERIEKSHGMMILKTSKLSSADKLIEVASEFSNRVLNHASGTPIIIHWHVAGSGGKT